VNSGNFLVELKRRSVYKVAMMFTDDWKSMTAD